MHSDTPPSVVLAVMKVCPLSTLDAFILVFVLIC